ncbi:MAG: M48 family metallopeptidase [Bacteroidia bacterium]|nr:M48 family metallopeptidase [Bacteroidia bacterium]
MKKTLRFILQLEICVLLFASCHTVPIIGRKQVNFYPEAEVMLMSKQQYSEFLKSHTVLRGTPADSMVQRVSRNLSAAVVRFFLENKLKDSISDFKWEYNLIESKEINAWCMPGGKIVVYTGILPVTKDETGLATVLAHEIAHAIARHGNERMSQQLAVQLGGVALNVALSKKEAETRQIFDQAYGIGSTLGVLLPFSRKHETEADKLGLIFMAMAGYDPNGAINFWNRMKLLSKDAPPPFLSTHPSDEQRIKDIQNYIPTALKYFKKR